MLEEASPASVGHTTVYKLLLTHASPKATSKEEATWGSESSFLW